MYAPLLIYSFVFKDYPPGLLYRSSEKFDSSEFHVYQQKGLPPCDCVICLFYLFVDLCCSNLIAIISIEF